MPAAGSAIPIAGPVSRRFFVAPAISLPRSLAPLCTPAAASLPTSQDRGYIAQLPASYVRGAGVGLAPLLLFGFGQVVESRLGFGGFFRQEGGIVACRFFDDAPQEARVRLGLVRRSV
jgi:hypothetical protein